MMAIFWASGLSPKNIKKIQIIRYCIFVKRSCLWFSKNCIILQEQYVFDTIHTLVKCILHTSWGEAVCSCLPESIGMISKTAKVWNAPNSTLYINSIDVPKTKVSQVRVSTFDIVAKMKLKWYRTQKSHYNIYIHTDTLSERSTPSDQL